MNENKVFSKKLIALEKIQYLAFQYQKTRSKNMACKAIGKRVGYGGSYIKKLINGSAEMSEKTAKQILFKLKPKPPPIPRHRLDCKYKEIKDRLKPEVERMIKEIEDGKIANYNKSN